jgi:hypothetical protein
MTNLSFIQHRIELHLQGTVDVPGANDVIVYWTETAGGTVDAVTGALVDAVEVPSSGVLRAMGVEEPARSVTRTFQEIQTGDVILDVLPEAPVATYPSGVQVPLDSLGGVRFQWGGRLYTQQSVGEDLVQAWSAIVGNQKLHRTLLLRRAT